MIDEGYIAIIAPHTHWDRAWYLPFQSFRIKLVDMMDRLINIMEEEPEYRYFTLDGQTVVLEDYLQVRPEMKERLKKLIREGRLFVGPWYCLPDEFIVSAESIIRNLLLGHRIAKRFGKVMKVGYLPDIFGHISQMPQILNGFGIDNFIFTRGMGEEEDHLNTEFYWKGRDGASKVLAIYQISAYSNGAALGYEPEWGDLSNLKFDMKLAIKQLKEAVFKLKEKASTRYLLINNGSDHLEPQPELSSIIREANKRIKNPKFIHGNFIDYIRAVREENPPLRTVRGEFRKGKRYSILTGVLSSRMYLKQMNHSCQRLFEKWGEPFSAFAGFEGMEYPYRLLWQGWRYILKSHPHDDICGCSIDEVHKDMVYRYRQADTIGNDLTDRAIEHIISRINTENGFGEEAIPILVFNPLSWPRQDVIFGWLSLPESRELPPRFTIVDSHGSLLPHQRGERKSLFKGIGAQPFNLTELIIKPKSIPPLGYSLFYIIKEKSNAIKKSGLKISPRRLENQLYKIRIKSNGSLDVTCKELNRTYYGWNVFEDREDGGDSYDYSPIPNSITITSKGLKAKTRILERGPLRATLEVKLNMPTPRSLTKDRKRRSSVLVTCPITSYITIYDASPRIDITTKFTNQASDHRLRVLFPLNGIKADYSYSEGQFDVVKRPIDIPRVKGWAQLPSGTQPQQHFMDVSDTEVGVTLINEGLPEYEVLGTCHPERSERVRTEKNCAAIALTLLRCVGWLSREDLLTRQGGNAGPSIRTPDAQCQGDHTFHYAIFPHRGSWDEAKVYKKAYEFDLLCRIEYSRPHKGLLPNKLSFLSVHPDNVIISAVKKAEANDSLIVRLYNICPGSTTATLKIYQDIKEAHLVNFNEEPIESALKVSKKQVKV